MDANTLCELVDARFDTLAALLKLSEQQVDAIDQNRMSDLMRVLSDKQRLIEYLKHISDQLKPALDDDPQTRAWESQAARERCHDRQQQCEQMHLQLLAIEAQCESTLQESRQGMEDQLSRMNAGQNAATGYSQSQSYGQPTSPGGGSSGSILDLSSN